MKKILSIMIVSLSLISLGVAKEWFEGGTLQFSTLREWSNAAERNKLASCADWVTVLYAKKLYDPEIQYNIQHIGHIKELAELCVSMLNSAERGSDSPEDFNEGLIEILLSYFAGEIIPIDIYLNINPKFIRNEVRELILMKGN